MTRMVGLSICLVALLVVGASQLCAAFQQSQVPPGGLGVHITSPTSLPRATVGVAYGPIDLVAADGTPPYTWSVTGLPTGLRLAGSQIVGTPAAGTATGSPYSVGITVTDDSLASVIFALGSDTADLQLAVDDVTVPIGPTITTAGPDLPDAQEGEDYESGSGFQFTASEPGMSWGLGAGSDDLPLGMTLSASGLLSGTPDSGTAETYNLVIGMKDPITTVVGWDDEADFTLTVLDGVVVVPPLAIGFADIDDGDEGVAYSFALSASGGTGSVTWSATGLPGGLNVIGSDITGTPTGSGTFSNIEITATDSASTPQVESIIVEMDISAAPPAPVALAISAISMAQGQVGVVYAPVALLASGGTQPYTWSSTGLPSGLSIVDVTGSGGWAIAGTPLVAAVATFSVSVTDAAMTSVGTSASVTILPAATPNLPVIATTTLNAATVGQSYTAAIDVSGGTAPFIFSASGLPAELTIDAASGQISGTPAAVGLYSSVVVTVTDAASMSDQVTLTLLVQAASENPVDTARPLAQAAAGCSVMGGNGTWAMLAFAGLLALAALARRRVCVSA